MANKNGSLPAKEQIRNIVDKIIGETPMGAIIRTEDVYAEIPHKRAITAKNVALYMRERYDLKWISAGIWERIPIE